MCFSPGWVLQGFLQFSADLEWIVDLPYKVVAYGTTFLFLSHQFMNVTITVCISLMSHTSDLSFKLISNSFTTLESSHTALMPLSW